MVFRTDNSPEAERAGDAWRQLTGRRVAHPIERLVKEKNGKPYAKSAVFRMVGAGPGGRSIVVKRARSRTVAREGLVYDSVLPRLSLNRPRFYGFVEDGELSWLFLDEVQGAQFSPDSADHRRLAVEWLAAFHTGSSMLPLRDSFPSVELTRHLEEIVSSRLSILNGLGGTRLSCQQEAALQDVARSLDDVREAWPRLTARCQDMPRCLVHADFIPKNVLVGRGGDCLFVLDWEAVGWGIPAMDLEYLEGDDYLSAVRRDWPLMTSDDVSVMKAVGTVVHAACELRAWAKGFTEDWADYAAESALVSSTRLISGFDRLLVAL